MVGVNDPLLDEDGWSKLRRILSQANLSLTSFGPARDPMVGHYLGVDPGREDDWKSPARREDLKAIWDLTEDFWEVGVHINEGKCGETYFYKDGGDDDWRRIEQLLDLSDDELVAHCDEWLTQEVEDCGEEDEEEEGAEDFSAEEVGKQDEEEDAEEGGYQVIGGARSGTPKVVHP